MPNGYASQRMQVCVYLICVLNMLGSSTSTSTLPPPPPTDSFPSSAATKQQNGH